MKILSALILLLVSLTSANAGLLDLRLGAGISAANPNAFEQQVNNLSGRDLSASSFETYNADVIFHLPILPITLGVRYEQASQKQSASSSEWKLNVNNLALLADWRLINTKIYVGPIVSIGYPWASVDFKNGATTVSRQIDSQQLSYSGGVTAGVYLGPLLLGAEAGYKSIRLKGGSSSSSVNENINLEGFYGKALVGMTFL